MKVIGFGYKKRVGKDTACKFLTSHLRQNGLEVQRLAMSDEIKIVAHHMYRWGGLRDRLYYDEHEDKIEEILPPIGKSPRQIWDHIGEQMCQLCDITWCELTFGKMKDGVVIIPSVRRLAEVNYIRKFNGKIYRIDRDDAPRSNHAVDNSLNNYNEWDGVLQNNGSLKDFYNEVITKVVL